MAALALSGLQAWGQAPSGVVAPGQHVVATTSATPPAAGAVWRSPSLGVMKWVPAGTFTMGSPPTEPGRYKNEAPHTVTLTRGFWMMEGEVTRGAWSAVMGSSPSTDTSCGPSCPVTSISWDDTQVFAARASRRDGVQYRLPTEAEWERAARGGQVHLYSGSDVAVDVGWVNANSDSRAHPACRLARNGFGLCDMTGNVWEWVADWYGAYASTAVVDPRGPSSGQWRVVRGCGSWVAERNMRVARRDQTEPANRSSSIGFRLVRSAE